MLKLNFQLFSFFGMTASALFIFLGCKEVTKPVQSKYPDFQSTLNNIDSTPIDHPDINTNKKAQLTLLEYLLAQQIRPYGFDFNAYFYMEEYYTAKVFAIDNGAIFIKTTSYYEPGKYEEDKLQYVQKYIYRDGQIRKIINKEVSALPTPSFLIAGSSLPLRQKSGYHEKRQVSGNVCQSR